MKAERLNNTVHYLGVPVYLSPDEAASVLHVTRRTVYEWLRTGQLQGYRPAGRWLISTDQIKAFVASRKPQTVSESHQIVRDRAHLVAVTDLALPAAAPSQVPTGAAVPPVAARSSGNRAERRRKQRR